MTVEARIERAQSLSSIGRHDDAISEARSAVGLDPMNARAHMSLAHASLVAGRRNEAINAAGVAAAIHPEWEWPHRLMAVAYRGQGKKFRKQERAAAEQAVKLAPEYAEGHYTLAESLRHDRRTRHRAFAEAERAVALSPEDDTAHLTLGNVHLSDGNVVAAEQAYRSALAIDPESPSARTNLALALRRQGRQEDAMPVLRKNVVENPGDRSNLDALLATADEFVKGGPLTKFMEGCLRLAILRVTLLLAALVAPFAIREQRARERQLPDDIRAARERRKQTIPRAQTKTDRIVFWVIAVIVIALITFSMATR